MARNVFGILDDISASVAELKSALAPLASIASGTKHSPKRKRAASMPARPAGKKRARRKAVSAATKAKRILQGRYLAAIRPLTKAQRVKVKKIQAKKGHVAAIRAAGLLLR
jgi:hypothetical protein